MILLDTHVLVWLAGERERLGACAGRRIRDAIDAGEASLSAMSLWEIAILRRKNRMTISRPPLGWLASISEALHVIPVDAAIALDSGSLDAAIHGDPIDRTIIATARTRHCPLVTADRAILGHGAAGHLQVIDARL